jgi:hypothetical protein
MLRRATFVTLALAASVVAACAGATTQQDGGSNRARHNVLTQEQLAATHSENLYDAIAKLEPEWLTSRGATSVTDATPTLASVFMSGTYLGKADYLREMRVIDVSEVRYWDAGQASARFGMGHPRGVIELTRK